MQINGIEVLLERNSDANSGVGGGIDNEIRIIKSSGLGLENKEKSGGWPYVEELQVMAGRIFVERRAGQHWM